MMNNTINFEDISRIDRLNSEMAAVQDAAVDEEDWRTESDDLLDEEDLAILESGVTAHHFL